MLANRNTLDSNKFLLLLDQQPRLLDKQNSDHELAVNIQTFGFSLVFDSAFFLAKMYTSVHALASDARTPSLDVLKFAM